MLFRSVQSPRFDKWLPLNRKVDDEIMGQNYKNASGARSIRTIGRELGATGETAAISGRPVPRLRVGAISVQIRRFDDEPIGNALSTCARRLRQCFMFAQLWMSSQLALKIAACCCAVNLFVRSCGARVN